ncbi:MAG: dihydropteroate synthase [Chloroflexi bacterium]|jgi:dihydropteroate synthase|nr:dihydropteroate synthase [Chloroflexota bacterium]
MISERLQAGGAVFEWGTRTYLMGIINVTPDSFSGDGLLQGDEREQAHLEKVLEQARSFAAAGVDIFDVGGESTRPGSEPVPVEEEIARVVPVVRMLSREFQIPISVDTYHAATAQAALEAGAHIINDIWGLRADPQMAAVAARFNAPVILMHNRISTAKPEVRERLGARYRETPYENFMEDVKRELLESVALAKAAGIPDEHIILDPGIGFAKSVAQNLEVIDRLDEIRLLGYPVLLAPSRKSFIGYTLDLPPDQRVEGTAAAVAVGIVRGADIVRVHDVLPISRVVRMTDAIVRRPVFSTRESG